MKKIVLLSIAIITSYISQAQLIDNKLNIFLGCSVGRFYGEEIINEDNYITPSLYSNYDKLTGFSVKGLINSKDYFSYGISYGYQSVNEWTSLNYSDYDGSKIRMQSITPLFRVHNKFNENGLSNKLLLFIEFGPSIGFSNLTLSKPLFLIQTNANNKRPQIPMSESDLFAGIMGDIGAEYSFTQSLGLSLSYSYNIDWVSSKFYNDKLLMNSLINIGLVMKFNKNKYFYY